MNHALDACAMIAYLRGEPGKARGRISLPDCFCIILAQTLSGEVVTSDHGEFDPLVPLGIVPIRFIR